MCVVSALAGLVDKGLMAPDWAEALAPVDDRIAAMGVVPPARSSRPGGPTCRPVTTCSARSADRCPTSGC